VYVCCVVIDAGGSQAQVVGVKPLSSTAVRTNVDVPSSSHFMPYFITITIVVVMLYIVYHKRNLVTTCTDSLAARTSIGVVHVADMIFIRCRY